MSFENPLWGAPRVHGEFLKLGFAVSQSTVGKYVARRSGPPGQSWSTFVRRHAPQIAAMDLFLVPGPNALRLVRSSVVCTTDTSESEFSVQTGHRSTPHYSPFPALGNCGSLIPKFVGSQRRRTKFT
jgi:hypothetical protein